MESLDLSTFSDYRSTRPVEQPLRQIVDVIRHDVRLQSLTHSYRQTGSHYYKESAPLFAPAVRFEGGKSLRHVRALTGLSLVDIDHIPGDEAALERLRARVNADPHTLLSYVTISGHGMRIIYAYEPTKREALDQKQRYYARAFATGNDYYESLLGMEPDRKVKNVGRLSGLAFDEHAYFNPQAQPFTSLDMETYHQRHLEVSAREKSAARISAYYEDTVAPKLAAEGIVYAPGSHNQYVMRCGYMMAAKRYPEDLATKWAMTRFVDYPNAASVFHSCYSSARTESETSRRTRRGLPMATVDDMRTFLSSQVRTRRNVVIGQLEVQSAADTQAKWERCTDYTVNSLWARMSSNYIVRKLDMQNLLDSDFSPLYNPFVHYLDSLPELPASDTRDYIGELAATVRVKGGSKGREYFADCFRRWLVAMVAAWVDHRVVNQSCLIFLGAQGIYKTTFFARLLPPSLQQYFYTKANSSVVTRDDILSISQSALICCEELDSLQDSELNKLKSLITMPSTYERAAYAHFREYHEHVASFCGTGNNLDFLTDATGNRRFLVFEVGSIDSPIDHPIAYDRVYAQAYALYKSGFRYWFNSEENDRITERNEQFKAPQLEDNLVRQYFRRPNSDETPEFITPGRAMQIISSNVSSKISIRRVSKAFDNAGFKRVRTHDERGFSVIIRTAEEIQKYGRTKAFDAMPDIDDEDEAPDASSNPNDPDHQGNA